MMPLPTIRNQQVNGLSDRRLRFREVILLGIPCFPDEITHREPRSHLLITNWLVVSAVGIEPTTY